MCCLNGGEKVVYEYIRGTITFVSPYYVVMENQGIGYQISLWRILFAMPPQKDQKVLFTYTERYEKMPLPYMALRR